MKKVLQRIRGAISIGVTWAVAWAPLGAITGWVTGKIFKFPLGVIVPNYVVAFSALGFVGGTLFSTVLSLAEGKRRFDGLSLPRFAAWGALGGLLLGGLSVSLSLLGSGMTVLGAIIVGSSTVLGAASAAGTLAVARAARAPALPGGENEEDAQLELSGDVVDDEPSHQIR
jgi:hypothetical protein